MNALKKAVEAKQAKNAAKNQPKKLSAKQMTTALAFGQKIVDHAVEAYKGSYTLLMECKGKDALTLAAIKQAVKDGWKKYGDTLTARKTHSSRDVVEGMKRASIWNRSSEQVSVISAFEKYALANPAARKAFDAKISDVTSYHALVSFCRHFNQGNAGKNGSDVPVSARERKAWQKNGSERVAKVLKALRWAPADALDKISEWCEKRIKMLTKSKAAGKAEVKPIRKAA